MVADVPQRPGLVGIAGGGASPAKAALLSPAYLLTQTGPLPRSELPNTAKVRRA